MFVCFSGLLWTFGFSFLFAATLKLQFIILLLCFLLVKLNDCNNNIQSVLFMFLTYGAAIARVTQQRSGLSRCRVTEVDLQSNRFCLFFR